MLLPYLKLLLVGCVLSIGFIGSYLIHRKQFLPQRWLYISLHAVAIGLTFALITCAGKSVFLFLVLVAIAALFFYADAARHDEKLEHMLIALMGGLLIGLTNLASMLLCCR